MPSEEFREVYRRVAGGIPVQIERTVEGRTFVRRFIPEERLILLGGGHISRVLCKMASMADYSVSVADDREEYANPGRFPEAARTVCAPFEEAIGELGIREGDYVCIMTREHKYDRTCLRMLLGGTNWPRYVGMVGSSRRAGALFSLLKSEGFDARRIDSIHAPVGLPIHALTPAEISVSILAEMILERRPEKLHEEDGSVLVQTTTDLSLLSFLAESDCPKALILVLESDGSTPVKSGAAMAVDAEGHIYGTIGGGLGEAQAIHAALRLIPSGGRMVTSVNMLNAADAEEGMACGGIMHVLIEAME